jgi:cytochrome c-type biogenesis protein CcmE
MKSLLPLLILPVFLLTAPLQAGALLEMTELLAHPDQYDKQEISVAGEVSSLQTATNREGQSAYGFLLKSAKGTVKVIGMGKTPVREGDQVIVEGVFNRLRQGGRTTVLNEIKAELVRPLSKLTPDLVG